MQNCESGGHFSHSIVEVCNTGSALQNVALGFDVPNPYLISSWNCVLGSISIIFDIKLHSSVMFWLVMISKNWYNISKAYSHSFVCYIFGGNQLLHLQKSFHKASLLEQDYIRFISVLVQSAEISKVCTLNRRVLTLDPIPISNPLIFFSYDRGCTLQPSLRNKMEGLMLIYYSSSRGRGLSVQI